MAACNNDQGRAHSMLPGFRILFVITFLSVSVLIFGLGAAAYLRSAHEDFASAPWRPIETPATARVDLAPATIALLRVEPENAPASPAPRPDAPVMATPPAETKVSTDTASAAPVATDTPAPRAEPAVPPMPAAVEAAPQPAQEIAGPPPAAEPARDVAPTTETKVTETKTAETKTADTKEPPPPPMVVAALPADRTEPSAKAVEEASPVAATPPATDGPAVAAPAAIASGADTLKADDKSIDAAPAAKIAALAEPASAEIAPLSTKEVKIPNPRVDPAVIEARRKRAVAQQRARARAALMRRIAAARARAAAQAKAAADPFGTPANTTATRTKN
jgi:hypothetical protein